MVRNVLFGCSLLLIFIAVLVPSLHVPMQSDDYAYYSLGLSLDAQLVHYMGWSGRIVTNTISSYLLNLLPHTGYEILNSAVFVLLIYFVCIMPAPLDVKWSGRKIFTLLLIFSLYWIANPALGETSFWIVGSTNYLWTSMFVAGYFVYLFRALDKNSGLTGSLTSGVLGFFAGCSNENTSVVVVLITIFMVVAEKNKRILLWGVVGSIIGAAVLIFSPGNKSRSNSFSEWKSLSLWEKFDLHFYDRFPNIMSSYWQVYLVIIISLLAVSMISNPNKKQLLYGTVFFVGAILANAAFVASPYVPDRAANGALVLLLMSLSFILSVIFGADTARLKMLYAALVSSFVLVYFVPSYYFFSDAVNSMWAQSKIKEALILEAKSKGLKQVEVPSYYSTRLLKPSDGLSTFDNSAIDLYYGMEKISYKSSRFDFAGIELLPKIDVDLLVDDNVSIKSIYAYDDGLGKNSKLLFEVAGNINNSFAGGAALYVHVFLKDGIYVNRDTAAEALVIQGANFTFSELGVDYSDIQRIELGMYRGKETISSFVINDPAFTPAD